MALHRCQRRKLERLCRIRARGRRAKPFYALGKSSSQRFQCPAAGKIANMWHGRPARDRMRDARATPDRRMKKPIQINYSAESIAASGVRVNWLKWGVFFGFWTLFSLLYANQIYFEMLHTPGMHHSWWRIAFWQLTVWYLWGF